MQRRAASFALDWAAMGSARVQIATDHPGRLRDDYLLAKLCWHWERMGLRIHCGPAAALDAELGIVHVDRTRVPESCVPANPCARPLLNAGVLDISKSRFSTLKLRASDAWPGPVIVKTELNGHGSIEGARTLLERVRRRLAARSWRLARALPPGRYPILENLAEVPGWVWRDPALLVEKFLPERDDGLYVVRVWVFFGSRGYAYRLFSTDPVVKNKHIVRHEAIAPPAQLEAVRQAHGFDFGKFDYVDVAGQPVLIDANKTPTIGSPPDTPRLRDLAEGIEELW